MTIIEQMINNYDLKSLEDKKNAIKEALQEVILAGLSKTDFFNHAAFYEGTALRIFYGIDRFSEDLDFSLIVKNENFDLKRYLNYISDAIKSVGLDFEVTSKKKSKESNIVSDFIKGNTKETFVSIYPKTEDYKKNIIDELKKSFVF